MQTCRQCRHVFSRVWESYSAPRCAFLIQRHDFVCTYIGIFCCLHCLHVCIRNCVIFKRSLWKSFHADIYLPHADKTVPVQTKSGLVAHSRSRTVHVREHPESGMCRCCTGHPRITRSAVLLINSTLINPPFSVPATELTQIDGVEFRRCTRVEGITDSYIRETLLPLSSSGQSVRLNPVGEPIGATSDSLQA